MAQKTAKKKPKKATKSSSDPSVLGNLRSSRPARIGGDRRGATTSPAAATKPSATTKAEPTAARKTSGTKATATKKAGAAKTAATPKPRAAAKPAADRPTPPPPPRPEPPRDGRPTTTEVVTTAVQAAGELAQIGLTVGRQALKRATDRIPRP
jgi:hypothetical protein